MTPVQTESGEHPSAILELPAGSEFIVDREEPIDGTFADLVQKFSGRDPEPITGTTATQFAVEAEPHTERYQFLIDWLDAELGSRNPTSIIDAGAGPGLLARMLAGRWSKARVWAMDLSNDMITLAERQVSEGPITLVEGDVRRIGDVAGPVDAVVSRRMIHRVDDLNDVLREMVGTLKPGGALVNYSFRRPNIASDRAEFERAAEVRASQPELHGAFVRAVLNAPSLKQYATCLEDVSKQLKVRSIKLLVYPFDIGIVVRR